jgi:hypothetical protein
VATGGFKNGTNRPAPPASGFLQQNRHFSDMAAVLSDVRCWRQSRKHLLLASISPFAPKADLAQDIRFRPIVFEISDPREARASQLWRTKLQRKQAGIGSVTPA